MKKLLSILLALAMMLSVMPLALADELDGAEVDEAEALSPLEVALTARPVSSEPTHITIGNPTKVKGSFFTTYFGNNTSDIDVRTMLHGYSPVVWDNQIQFVVDPMVAERVDKTTGPNGTTFTVTLARDLLYNDGVTPVTAQDYVFAWLLSCCPQIAEIGANVPKVDVLGFDAFHAGTTQVLSGVRLLGDYSFSVTLAPEFDPYFYDYSRIALNPCPISVIAPGCTVRDGGMGAYIEGDFTADLLQDTILDPSAGYSSHPMLTCGPYSLVSYDAEAGVVEFARNPYYKGNCEGVKPVIDTVTLVPVTTENMIAKLESGEVDALNKCVDQSVIMAGMQLAAGGDFEMTSYARLGYGFCAFSCEQGPQQFPAVRQALNYAFDSEAFIRDFLGGFGLPVYGYYGIGQWMVGAVNGTARPEDLTEEEEAEWDALSLDSLNTYPLDLDEANRLLDEDGWVLNEGGDPYNPAYDALRYKLVDGKLMPLSLRFAKSRDNPSADMVVAMYAETLPLIGAKLRVEEVDFNELLADYYRDDSSRRYDMNFMATNFVSTFDPYLVFSGRGDMQGAVNTSGIVDEELVNRAFEMRSTEPGDLLTFEQRWISMQERYNEILPTMPIYSNVYFDFHTDWLQNYYPNAEYSWPVALLYAFYGEPVAEEVEEEIDSDMEDEVFFEADTQPAAEASAISLDWEAVVQALLEEYDEAPAATENAPTVPADAPSAVSKPATQDAPVTASVVTTLPPKNGVAYRPGEIVTFMVTAVNHTSDTLRNLTVSEKLSGKTWSQFEFLHGAKVPFLFSYTVTEADAQLGSFRAEASVSYVSRDGVEFHVGPVFAEFPASF